MIWNPSNTPRATSTRGVARIAVAMTSAVLAVGLLGACSADSLAEFGLERALESSAEGDVDIDLDFSEGGLSVSGDDGEFSIAFDEDDGSIVFDSDEGSGSIQFDENGTIVYDTDQGSGTVGITESGITLDADNDEFDAQWSIGDDGDGSTLTTNGATAQFGLTTAPDSWPSFVAEPRTNVNGETIYSVYSEGDATTHTANFQHDVNEPFAQATIDGLLAQGFTSDFTTTMPDGVMAQLGNGELFVMVIGSTGGMTSVTITPIY